MRRALWSLALLLAVACPRADWTTVSSPEGGFEVEMPGEPRQTRHRVDTAAGPLEFTILGVQVGPTSYQIAWVEYPAGAVADPEQVLDAARDGAVARSGARLVSEVPFEFQGHPGREIELDVGGRVAGLDRLILAGNRLYQLLLATRPGRLRDPTTTRFLASFRLLEGPP